METITKPLVKVVKITDSRYGQIGQVIDVTPVILTVKFPDAAEVPFLKDEVEEFRGFPCPHCLNEGELTELSELYKTDEGTKQKCPRGHEVYAGPDFIS